MSLGCLGSYDILERIGEGGVGVVFKARDTRLNRIVALKVLSESMSGDEESRARLLREARAEACLSHPNVAICFELGAAAPQPPDLVAPGTPGPHPELVYYLAMEYVPGRDLLSLIEQRPLPTAQVLDLAVQIAAGLEAAHAARVLHRDLKPGNVRVTPEGRVKILDFGLARIWEAKDTGEPPSFNTSEGRIMGTASYMAPEQARGGQADARSDLFAFGVLLYQTITGHLPFTGASTLEIFHAASTEEPPPLARYARDVPQELERIVRKLIAKRPPDRYQSAHEVLTDLSRLRESRAPSSPSAGRGGRPRRVAALVLLAAIAIVVVAAIAWWVVGRVQGPPPHSLAVLPFENATGDTILEAEATGLAEDLRNGLVQHTDLNVVSRGATAALPKGDRTPKTVARELGVGAMLTGTVRRQAGGAQLEVELVDTHSGYVRWSATYDLSAGQALRSEQDMVQRVAARLRARTDFAGPSHKPALATSAIHAYDEYLVGVKELQDADDPQAEDRAADRFAAALSQDPEFTLALAGRARALLRIYKRDKQPEILRSAQLTADQAIQLAPDLLEARIARSEILRATGHFDEAIADLQQVVARRPNWDEGFVQLAATYRDAGRLAEAETWFRKAVTLRPDYWKNWNSLGAILYRRGDYAGARAAFAEIVRLVPDKNRGYEQLAAVDVKTGAIDRAIAEYRRLPTPVADGVLASNLGTALYYARRLGEAEEFYRLAVRTEPNTAMFRQNLGDCLNREGRFAEAKDAYREAVRLGDDDLRETPGNPDLAMQRALYLAKAGECAQAKRALDELTPHMPKDVADYAYRSAMLHSLCGRRAQALRELGRAIALGTPAKRAAEDDEFLTLRDDPEFQSLTGGHANAPARPGTAKTKGLP